MLTHQFTKFFFVPHFVNIFQTRQNTTILENNIIELRSRYIERELLKMKIMTYNVHVWYDNEG